jgi:DNA-binding NarL/FixJ family response regulator
MFEKINKEQLSPDSAKIILSNKGQQEDIDRGMSLGASGYIIKVNTTPVEVIDNVMKIMKEKVTINKEQNV